MIRTQRVLHGRCKAFLWIRTHGRCGRSGRTRSLMPPAAPNIVTKRPSPQPYAPRRSRPRRTRPLGKRAPRSFSRCEPRGFELVEEAWAGAEPLHVAAAAFEEWVGGEAVSFDALDFNDLVDLAGEEALF